MVRRKQSISESVQLLLLGPKSILPETVIVSAPLNRSWYEFLSQEVGLEVTQESGIFVCTRSYTPSDPKDGVGWRSELSETVGQFVRKFERCKKQFCVRICQPENLSRSQKRRSFGVPEKLLMRSSSSIVDLINIGANITADKHENPTTEPEAKIPAHEQFRIPRITPGTSISLQPTSRNSKYYPPTSGVALNFSANQKQGPSRGSQQKRSHSQTLNEISLNAFAGCNNGLPDPLSVDLQRKRPKLQTCSASSNGGRDSIPIVDNIRSVHIQESEPVDTEWDGLWGLPYDPIPQQQTHHTRKDDIDTSDDSGNVPDFDEDDEFDDNASLCTAVTVEENELRSDGIQVEDVKSFVEGRMSRFGNAYLLRVRNEIRKLRHNNMWDRNVNRSPLACYLLTEMFKE